MNECLNTALEYRTKYNFSIIPFKPDKKGSYLKSWTEYQKRIPTEEEIKEWWKRWPAAMIAIVCGKLSNRLVIDIDSEKAKEEISRYIPDSLITPTVNSPRGGSHLYFEYPNNGKYIGPIVGLIPGVDVRAEGSVIIAPPSKNDNGKIYQWVIPITNQTEKIPKGLLDLIYIYNNKLYNNNARDEETYKDLKTLTNLNLLGEEGTRDDRIFHVANCMARGGLEQAYCCEVLESLYEKLNQNSISPFSKEQIRIKIDSAFNRNAQRERNLTDEIKTWISLNDLNFSLKDLKSDLKVLNSKEANILYVAINSLCKQGVIEKEGKIPGLYRKTENKINFVDISEAEDLTYLDLKWPLEVEHYVGVSPKSISVVAGETEAGKSAFLSNFSYLNLDTHKILYFSSEMTASRFKKRISTLPRPLKDWKKLLFTSDKTDNFQDSIDPNAINIIDYLELDPGKTFDVATYIRKIFEKLDRGIAIIALQKKRGESLAYGRDWTMQKSEFYITMSVIDGGNIAKIEKAKNWTHPGVNPVGLKRKFYIIDGVKIIQHKMRPDWFKHEGNEEGDYL